MATNFIQPGDMITYTNDTGTDIASGAPVIINNMMCIALVDIADTKTGECATEGVFEVAKTSSSVLAQGEAVIWDVSATAVNALASAAAGDVVGGLIAWAAAGNGMTVVKVKLANPGTIQA